MLDSGSHSCSRSISQTHTHTTSATLPSDSICPACSLRTLHLHTIQQTLQTNEFHSVFLSFSFIFPIVFELKCILNQWACTLNFPQQHIYLFASLIFMDFVFFLAVSCVWPFRIVGFGHFTVVYTILNISGFSFLCSSFLSRLFSICNTRIHPNPICIISLHSQHSEFFICF